MFKSIYHFFDKLEDVIRGKLSHYPIIYALIGGIGIVLFWRGVWHTADYVTDFLHYTPLSNTHTDLLSGLWWDGPLSFISGSIILLATGSFVSSFIGNEIIISGLRGEKKLTEKTESETRHEASAIASLHDQVQKLSEQLDRIEQKIK